MQLDLLHLDNALSDQAGFLGSCLNRHARPLNLQQEGGRIRLWGRENEMGKLKERLRAHFAQDDQRPRLCFMGSGDFHHVSALLVAAAAERQSQPITIVHFDNHPDWVHYKGGIHCGSWVNHALATPNVAKVITLGICSNDLVNPERKKGNLKPMAQGRLEVFPYRHAPSRVHRAYGHGPGYRQQGNLLHWQTMNSEDGESFLERLLSRIPTKNIYVTIDKDVLIREDAETNWDQGEMRLPWLLTALQSLGMHHHIVAADVTGDYSQPSYRGGLLRRIAASVEILMDQPRHARDRQRVAALNGATNVQILDAFAGIMA